MKLTLHAALNSQMIDSRQLFAPHFTLSSLKSISTHCIALLFNTLGGNFKSARLQRCESITGLEDKVTQRGQCSWYKTRVQREKAATFRHGPGALDPFR